MKQKFTLKISILFIVILLGFQLKSSAQTGCPGCTINNLCDNPGVNFPRLCPDSLPDGQMQQYYDQNVTFWMPYIIDAAGMTGLNLEEVTILNIAGMPAGLSWESNAAPTNFYDITSNISTQRGCVKICGTPVVPGQFNCLVNVQVKICNIPILGCSTLTQSFTLPIKIDPPAGGNPYFNFTPSLGCAPLAVNFNANFNFPEPQITEYDWSFGNGTTSIVQNPPTVTYTSAGAYPVSLQTKISRYVFNSCNVTASTGGPWWCGDIEELNCGNGNADLYFKLTHGGVTYQSTSGSNSLTNSWNNLGIQLQGFSIALSIWDADNGAPFGSPDDDGGTYTYLVTGPGTFNFTTAAPSGGGSSGSFTILKVQDTVYTASDTIHVFDLPPATTVAANPANTVCGNVPLVLSVYGGAEYTYEWYLNDTTLIIGANSNTYTVPVPGLYPYTGNYKVKIISTLSGCAYITPNTSVTIKEPIPAAFSTSGISYNNFTLGTSYSQVVYQWLLNGQPIGGANANNFKPEQNGNYSLVITNTVGCSDTSNVIAINDVSVEDFIIPAGSVNIYPNPNDGRFTLDVEAYFNEESNINIYNAVGQKIWNENMILGLGKNTKSLNLAHLSSGIYILELQLKAGVISKKLVIK